MLTLISPAKKLLDITQPFLGTATQPMFLDHTLSLIQIMQCKSPLEIANLMHLSPALAQLNYERYQHFLENNSLEHPALYLFQGDVYQGLEAWNWDEAAIQYAQNHLIILSGLYGLLKPLDLIKAHRLEMGTRLINPKGNNLYQFWTSLVTQELNKQLQGMKVPILINLASSEYFKVVQQNALQYPTIHIHFKEGKALKTIGIYAKKARGVMARYIMQNQLDNATDIQHFNALNYRYSQTHSDASNWVFIR